LIGRRQWGVWRWHGGELGLSERPEVTTFYT
jgi:hypothetical protein